MAVPGAPVTEPGRDVERLRHALASVAGMLDHTTSRAVSASWQDRWPDQYAHAVSLIRRSRRLLRGMIEFTLLVTGGRDFSDRAFVYRRLDAVHAKRRVTRLIHGGADGLDRLAAEWAENRGVPAEAVPAPWNDFELVDPSTGRRAVVPRRRRDGTPYNAAAGWVRNQTMVDRGADGAVVFPGGRGTRDCHRRIVAAGIAAWVPAYR